MEKITFGDENIESIGLVFEPNFFRVYGYSDENGEHFKTSKAFKYNEPHDFTVLRSKNHLFALSSLPQWTIVPAAIFREEDAQEYLKLNTDLSPGDEVAFTRLDGLEAVLIRRKDKESEQLLSQIQPAMEGNHLASVLLESTRRKAGLREDNLMQVVILDGVATIIIFKDGKLLLANSVVAEKAEDLLYYIFYTLKKLNIPAEIPAEILGFGTLVSSVRSQGMKFLRNLETPDSKSDEHRLAKILSRCA